VSERHTVGVVGAGGIAESLHLPVLTSMPGVRVAWITDVNAESARRLGAAYGVPAVELPPSAGDLPDCDAVLLAIPLGVRRPYFGAFAARGTAVMAEKPFAVTRDEHEAVVKMFEPNRVACGYQRRTFDNTLLVRRMVEEGWFGGPRRMVLREGDRVKRTGADARHFDDVGLAGGGVLISLGCHSIDWAVFVTGASEYEILEQDVVFDGDLDRKVTARIRLSGGSGPVDVDYTVSWLDVQPNHTEMCFENAEISLGVGPGVPIEVRRPGGGTAARLVPREGGAENQNQACFLEWSAFLEGLDTGVASAVAASETLLTTAIMDDIYRSARGQ
jgi:predicted dehydrogenase